MMAFRADRADPLIHPCRGTGRYPEQCFDVIMVVLPEYHGIAKDGVGVSSIK